jgi:aspartyl-tRNA(Asn)/glutamyl-tRNA(Gln) amidotransferase subunit A
VSSTEPAATVREIASAVREGRADPDRFFQEALERAREADEGEQGLNAFLALVEPEDASAGGRTSARAEPASSAVASSRERAPAPAAPSREPASSRATALGPLAGVPVAVKDNLCTLDLPTTCGSRILEGYRAPYEATVVRRLRAAGARIVGKTNMDEFAMGSSTENSAFGPTRNPIDRERVPGGSSGGSAAAVASGVVPCALGSDTGGSVRQPAALCGVVGIKPTYGRVSRYGLVAFASSLDQVGAFGRTVSDAALLLEAVAGYDPRDPTSVDRPVPDLEAALEAGVEGRIVGIPREYLPDTLHPGVRARFDEAAALLESAGAEVRGVSLPHTRFAVSTYYVLAPAEASSNLGRYDGVRYGARAPDARSTRELYEGSRTRGFGPEVVRRIMLGTFALSAGYHERYYGRAQTVRTLIARDFDRVWAEGIDFLFTPTSPTPAFRLGERTHDPVAMYLSDVFTVTANLAGIPGISVPIGTVDGLPVGGQLLAPPWEEVRLVAGARVLEEGMGGASRSE